MSKVDDEVSRDGREAFHRATMAVYTDLGRLIDILKREPDLRVALLALDTIAEHRAPERGDTKLIANLKHAVGHLLESLNTVEQVRRNYHRPASTFFTGHGIDRTWGAISSASYHGAALGAAEAMLEPDAEGAAQSGREAPPGGASGLLRRKVIEAAMDAEAWARLAENLAHEYQSASLLPHSTTGEPKPAPDAIEAVQLEQPEEGDFANAMERYDRSCDEMRTVRLNPRTVISVDQWPKETQLQGSAIVRVQDWKRYVRYVLRVAARNERHADQARTWWAWWEKTQLEPSKAGPEPLVSPNIEVALRAAAAHRSAESPMVTGNNEGDARKAAPAGLTDDLVTLQQLAAETKIRYSTLTSRRLRMAKSDQPQPHGEDEKRRQLFRRSDWYPIVAAIRAKHLDA